MPDDTVRVLRCLVKGTTIPMKISLSVDNDVDDLKAMVHNTGKNGILRDADIPDLFVWKLKKQESLVPEESLGDRVFSQGHLSTIAVKLESSARIGDIFKDQPKLGLHIVVQLVPSPTISPSSSLTSNISARAARKRNLDDIGSREERGERHKADSSIVDDGPSYVNFGFDRLSYDNTPTDSFLRFYEKFWGVPLPQEHISLTNSIHDFNDGENDEENGGENGGDVLPATPPPIIDTPWAQVFIRAEYLRIYNWVESMYTAGKVYRPSAIVVTGQPGIGKSFWAYYVLRRRLGDKSVSLWYQGSVLYLFCSEGVLLVPATFTLNKFSPPVWTIIDSVQSSSGIPSTLTHFPPGVFPIYITSPKPERWSGITQSWTSHHVIMNPWTRAEIKYTIILYSDQTLDKVLKKYDSLGPTANFCFELTSDEIARHTSDRHRAIENTSPDRFKQLFSDSSGLSFDTLSHKICLVRRKQGSALGDGNITTDLISVEVEQQVVQRLEKFSDDQLLDMWTYFSKFGDARGMTGSIFQVFVHRRFRTRIYLDAMPMVRSNRANSRLCASFSTNRPQSATVQGVAQQVFSLRVDVGSTFVYDTTIRLSIRPDVYYVPRSGQQVALDSFILREGYLNVFQCTGHHDHDIKSGIYDFLASCSGLPPRTNWRFVFVIPDDLVSFSCPASSVTDVGLYTARIPMSKA
ncbi:hypothetical protein APHAL10511_007926 [Amanita phalloides]|nr:hypothetical protein APHAL10511_007926 [Amanita phalloides]